MRFLIIDDSRGFRAEAAQLLRAQWPEATIDEWMPAERGRPLRGHRTPAYDAVLIDSRPAGEDGIEWVSELRRDASSPVIVLTAEGGEHQAVRAIRAGAADFLRKDTLQDNRLARSVQEAIAEHHAQQGGTDATDRTTPLDARTIGTTGSPLASGEPVIAGYRLQRLIGEGAMSRVYLAERESDRMPLALKVLEPEYRSDERMLARFLREHELLTRLRTDHVAAIIDHDFTGGYAYIAMEFIPGGDLKARIAAGMSSLVALRMLAQIARALDVVHGAGVVHRDLKPQNILFRSAGRPVLVDFGLAKDLNTPSTLTHVGELIATPRYMSPEQCLGRDVDARADLYSMGAIFYEMLTGTKLYASENAAGLLYQHVHGEVPALPRRFSGYQPILDRLLARRPEDRFQSARELFTHIAI